MEEDRPGGGLPRKFEQVRPDVRFESIQLDQTDGAFFLEDVMVESALERPVRAADIASQVRRDLDEVTAEVRQWTEPTFADLERLARRLRQLAVSADGIHARVRFEPREGLEPSALTIDYAAVVPDLWTAAQVAATSIALGSVIANRARRWRRRELPQGSRLTLTITPSKDDDQRRRVRIVIYDMQTKSAAELTREIGQAINEYAGDSRPSPRRVVGPRRPEEHGDHVGTA
jgi:hypothetical protein